VRGNHCRLCLVIIIGIIVQRFPTPLQHLLPIQPGCVLLPLPAIRIFLSISSILVFQQCKSYNAYDDGHDFLMSVYTFHKRNSEAALVICEDPVNPYKKN
jgi:hypothetical protein